MSNELTPIQARAAAIVQHLQQAEQYIGNAMEAYWRAGGELIAAKEECGHGNWLPFLEIIEVKERSAQMYMRFHREYTIELARQQEGLRYALEAKSNPQPVSDLTAETGVEEQVEEPEEEEEPVEVFAPPPPGPAPKPRPAPAPKPAPAPDAEAETEAETHDASAEDATAEFDAQEMEAFEEDDSGEAADWGELFEGEADVPPEIQSEIVPDMQEAADTDLFGIVDMVQADVRRIQFDLADLHGDAERLSAGVEFDECMDTLMDVGNRLWVQYQVLKEVKVAVAREARVLRTLIAEGEEDVS